MVADRHLGQEIDSRHPAGLVSSTMMMASAPSGIGAPVMIRMVSPDSSGRGATDPAGMVPTTGRVNGLVFEAPMVSAARTANPSIAVLSNGGNRLGRRDRLGQDHAEGVGQRDVDRNQDRKLPVDLGLGFLQSDHVPRVEPRSRSDAAEGVGSAERRHREIDG